MIVKDIRLSNHGTVNKNSVRIFADNGDSIELFFSYETIVAFQVNGDRYTSENQWSKTTGKFLNELEPDKSKRLNANDFADKLKTLFN